MLSLSKNPIHKIFRYIDFYNLFKKFWKSNLAKFIQNKQKTGCDLKPSTPLTLIFLFGFLNSSLIDVPLGLFANLIFFVHYN